MIKHAIECSSSQNVTGASALNKLNFIHSSVQYLVSCKLGYKTVNVAIESFDIPGSLRQVNT